MSNVIYLKGRESGRKPVTLPAGTSAEIMIFHGVRFERLTDEMIKETAPASRRLPSLSNQATAAELE